MEITTAKAKHIYDGGDWLCVQARRADALKVLESWKDGVIHTITVKVKREKRSLNANAYFWVIADKIAESIGSTKEAVYRKAIKDVGVFEIVPVREDALAQWIDNWESGGLGRVCDVLGDSKLDGYVRAACYFGSSVYDKKQMARLIDWIVEEAKELGIQTMSAEEIEKLKADWRA